MEVWGPQVEMAVEGPTWRQVEKAVRALDEHESSDVLLASYDQRFLAVAGGNGRYLVFAQEPRGNGLAFANLINPDAAVGPPVLLVVGGVYGDFQPRQLVDLQTALRAARPYFNAGDLEPDLPWELESEEGPPGSIEGWGRS
jgi:hypothetical protein